MGQTAAMAEADRTWMIDTLLALLQTPSPSGRTDAVMQVIGDILDDFGVPFTLTRRGALTAELPGESATTDRALVVHSDTIGCMVRNLKDNGRLELVPVGTFSARFAAGRACASSSTTPTSSSPAPSCRSSPAVMRSATRSTPNPPTGSTSRFASTAGCRRATTWFGSACRSVISWR